MLIQKWLYIPKKTSHYSHNCGNIKPPTINTYSQMKPHSWHNSTLHHTGMASLGHSLPYIEVSVPQPGNSISDILNSSQHNLSIQHIWQLANEL